MKANKLRILVVEDAPGDVFIIKFYLEEIDPDYYEIFEVGTLREAHEMIERDSFDIILLDLHLPDSEGIVTLTNTIEKFPDEVFIVMTGISDETVGVEAVKKGAQDFLVKGKLNSTTLDNAIKFAHQRAELKRSIKVFKQVLSVMEKIHDFESLFYYKKTGVIKHSPNLYSYLGGKDDIDIDKIDDFTTFFKDEDVEKIRKIMLEKNEDEEIQILDVKSRENMRFVFHFSKSKFMKDYVIISINKVYDDA